MTPHSRSTRPPRPPPTAARCEQRLRGVACSRRWARVQDASGLKPPLPIAYGHDKIRHVVPHRNCCPPLGQANERRCCSGRQGRHPLEVHRVRRHCRLAGICWSQGNSVSNCVSSWYPSLSNFHIFSQSGQRALVPRSPHRGSHQVPLFAQARQSLSLGLPRLHLV